MALIYLNINEKEFLKSKRIQKFLSLERALQMLSTQKMWFSNPAKWPDPYERRFIDGVFPDIKNYTWKNRVYCMCITPIATSEASWKAYSEKDFSVKLEFDRNEYINILNNACNIPGVIDVFLGKMDYQQTRNIEKPLTKIKFEDNALLPINSKFFKARLLLLKRIAFKYEAEYRAIIVKQKKGKSDGILVDIPDIHKLVKSITIGPTIGDYEFEMVKNRFIDVFGFTNKQIMRSNLYRSVDSPVIKNK